MNLKIIEAEIRIIKDHHQDDEQAHAIEDGLMRGFIMHVAQSGSGELSVMAELILTTKDIDFQRWYG